MQRIYNLFIFTVITCIVSVPVHAENRRSEHQWSLIPSDRSCLIEYNESARGARFSYEVYPDGEVLVGVLFPEWDPDAYTESEELAPMIISYGAKSFVVGDEIDSLVGRKIGWHEKLEPSDFAIFQDYDAIEIKDGRYRMTISTVGVNDIRTDFAKCLVELTKMPTLPGFDHSSEYAQKALDATVIAMSKPRNKELVINVNEAGKVVGCRAIPDLSESQELEAACTAFRNVRFRPSLDSAGKPTSGEWIAFANYSHRPD